jgi:hypothetical protein
MLNGSEQLSLLLLKCRTICKYLDRLEVNEWIELELDGYYGKYKTNQEFLENVPAYRKQSPIFYLHNGRPIPLPYSLSNFFGQYMALGNPISHIEMSEVLTITSGTMIDQLNEYLNKEYEKVGERNRNVIAYAQFADNHIKTVKSGLRKRIGDFVDEIILELEYGQIPEEIFQTLRYEVDQKLARISPKAIEKLANAYDKIGSSGSSEDWSHVAATCRRVIKDVADVVFPAQDTPLKDDSGKETALDDSKYINRIIAGIRADVGKGKDRKFNESMIEYVANFLRGIQSYASKGDHATFQKTDAIRCLLYTYMLLGDVLNYYVDKDERNVGEVKASEDQPDITIVNFHPEFAANNTLKLFPNFRNDGISARTIKIHHKVFNKNLTLKEIVAKEREIKKSVIEVPGTVRHGDSVNLNDGKESSGILFPNTDGPKSVVLWLNYRYGDSSEGEVIIDLRYEGKRPASKHPIRYTRSDIKDLGKS